MAIYGKPIFISNGFPMALFKSKKAIDVFFKPHAQSMSVDESDDEGMQCAVQ